MKIAVALSGGVDSATCLFLLKQQYPNAEICGITLKLTDDYLDKEGCAIWKSRKLCERFNIKHYVVDYYYEYNEPALIYTIQKERFNGLFTLEGKFYSKDENDGLNYTNLIYMPKVRVVSDINLRLGERADPTVSVFNIIGLPETTTDKKNMILEITRLGEDIDDDELI